MRQIEHIRKTVLKLTQTELGKVAGVSQATVSRWETGDLEPSRLELQHIREEAKRRRIKWNDAAFFEAAPQRAPSSSDGAAA